MARALAFLVLALLFSAGCAGPVAAPADAVWAEDEGLPGLRLQAWAEIGDEEILLRGVLENTGDATWRHRWECGEPWNSTMLDPWGQEVRLRIADPCGEYHYAFLAPGQSIEFRQSWELQGEGGPVATGAHTWHLAAAVVRPEQGRLEAVVPVPVERGADQGWSVHEDGDLTLRARAEEGRLTALVESGDARPWPGCDAWNITLGPGAEAVPDCLDGADALAPGEPQWVSVRAVPSGPGPHLWNVSVPHAGLWLELPFVDV